MGENSYLIEYLIQHEILMQNIKYQNIINISVHTKYRERGKEGEKERKKERKQKRKRRKEKKGRRR